MMNELMKSNDIIMNDDLLSKVDFLSQKLAASTNLPAVFQKNEGLCFSVVMQAMRWNLDPWIVANGSYQCPGQRGKLCYHAQFIHSLILASGEIKGVLNFDFKGDWSKIRNQYETVQNPETKKYYKRAIWYNVDISDLSVEVKATLRNGDELKMEVFLCEMPERFSTQWAYNPKQQASYQCVIQMARRYFPHVIYGMYTPEEMEYSSPSEPQSEKVVNDIQSQANALLKKPVETEIQTAETEEDFTKQYNPPAENFDVEEEKPETEIEYIEPQTEEAKFIKRLRDVKDIKELNKIKDDLKHAFEVSQTIDEISADKLRSFYSQRKLKLNGG